MSIDPALQMFISVCYTCCSDTACLGALTNISKRKTCQKYLKWCELPKEKQTKLFMTAAISEIELLEELINE